MFDSIFYIFIYAGIFFVFVWILYRRYRGFNRSINHELGKHHFKLINTTPVPFFSKCPFPNEIYSIGVSTEILGISGEEVFHRFIKFRDTDNQEHKVRIMIYTVAFAVKKIKWEKELSDY